MTFDDDFSDIFDEPFGGLQKPKPEPKPMADLTDKEVDAIFADIAADLESEPEVIEAAAKVIEAEAIITQAEADLKAKQDEYNALKKEEEEARKLLDRINNRLATIRYDLMDVREKSNKAKRDRNEKAQRVEIVKQGILAKRKFDRSEELFEKIASNKRWWLGLENGNKILSHQWTGARYLASAQRCILGDGMGLGKTLTSIAALDLVQSKRALVVCPADVASNFVNEIKMWAPHRNVLSMKGKTKKARETIFEVLGMLDEYILVINYEAWRRDVSTIKSLVECHFDTVILDESHNIKSTSSDAYQGCKEIISATNRCPYDGTALNYGTKCPQCNWNGQRVTVSQNDEENYYAARSVVRVWCMTGTSILNVPGDIYAPLSLIDPLNFYNRNAFLREYAVYDEYDGRWTFRRGGVEELTKRLKGRYLARSLADTGIELPPQFPTIHELELDENYALQARVIQQLTKHSQIVLSSGKTMTAFAVIALITRQRQANVWPGGIKIKDEHGNIVFSVADEVTESIKIDKAVEIIVEQVNNGQRVALFSQFSTALEELQSRLDGMPLDNGKWIRSVRFDGSTPDGVKEEIKANFNKSRGEEAKWDVVLANYKTGGVGLNLTAATHTVILDEEWNPGKRDQAYARTRRLGQDESTFVHVLRITNTIDAWLAGLIESKESMIAGFDAGTQDIQQALLRAIENGEISG